MPPTLKESNRRRSHWSFSAPILSDKEQKRELALLTEKQRAEIIKDMYGQHTERQHGEDDISEELLDKFVDELEAIPNEEKEDYLFAMDYYPSLIRTESNPDRFLRSVGYNPHVAARRLVEYWKLRLELFQGRAFEPMTVSGALTHSEVDSLRLLPSLVRILPDDKHGRTVICYDKTGIKSEDFDEKLYIKMLWIITHLALEEESAQRNGIIFLIIRKSSKWSYGSVGMDTLRIAVRSFEKCLPVKVYCLHFICTSLMVGLLIPTIKFFMSSYSRQRIQVHSSINESATLKKLNSFGLKSECLPKSVGGSYHDDPPFSEECKHLVLQRRRSKKRRTLE